MALLAPGRPASAQLADIWGAGSPVRDAAVSTYCRAALLPLKAAQLGPLAEMLTRKT